MVKSERLRALREKRGLSQAEASRRLGIVRTTYSNYEAGNRQPDNETLKKIAEFFEVSVDYLLGLDKPFIINDQAKNAVIEEYTRLPQEEKRIVDDLIKMLVSKRPKQ